MNHIYSKQFIRDSRKTDKIVQFNTTKYIINFHNKNSKILWFTHSEVIKAAGLWSESTKQQLFLLKYVWIVYLKYTLETFKVDKRNLQHVKIKIIKIYVKNSRYLYKTCELKPGLHLQHKHKHKERQKAKQWKWNAMKRATQAST